jgi:threonine dehydratase
MTNISLEAVTIAKEALDSIIVHNPLQFSTTFSKMAGCSVFLKPECLQKNGSFKIRGAYYMFSQYTPVDRKKGVVTFSAGNWAQGASYAGFLLGIPVTVVMPENANPKKAAATRGYGGEVILFGKNSNELYQKARELAQDKGAIFVNPLENLDMIIGDGTVGLEVLEEEPEIDVVVVPVGGGGLIAGIASAIKEKKPNVKIYGVQPEGASAMIRSLRAGKVVELDKVNTIADGLAVKRPDENTFRIIQDVVDDIVLVSDQEIKETIFLLLERAKLLVEPAGAVSLAGVVYQRIPNIKGKNIATVLTGGNIDFRLLTEIITSHL